MYFYFLVSIVSLQCICNVIFHAELTERILGNYESSNNSSNCLLQTPSHVNQHTESKESAVIGLFLQLHGFTICYNSVLIYTANALLGVFFNSHVDSLFLFYHLLKC